MSDVWNSTKTRHEMQSNTLYIVTVNRPKPSYRRLLMENVRLEKIMATILADRIKGIRLVSTSGLRCIVIE